jgi:hypothetical protein
MKGIVERDHFFGQGDRAGKDRSKRIGDRHQGHGQTSWSMIRKGGHRFSEQIMLKSKG